MYFYYYFRNEPALNRGKNMRRLRNYQGQNQDLSTIINEINHGIGLFERASNDSVKRRVLPMMEASLVSLPGIIDRSPFDEDRVWLAGNRIEVDQLLEWLTEQRELLGHRRNPQVQRNYDDLRYKFEKVGRIYEDPSAPNLRKKAALTKGAKYAGVASGIGIVATGAAAGSFAAGPAVGGGVTGGVGAISFFGVVGAGAKGAHTGYKKAETDIEETIRNHNVFG